MSFNLPMLQSCKSPPSGPPAWYQGEPDEQFLRLFGNSFCCCGSGSGNRSAIAAALLAAGAGIAVSAFDGTTRHFAHFFSGNDDSVVVCTSMLLAVAVVVFSVLRHRSLQTVLTDRRLLFRERGRVSEIRLREITRLTALRLRNRPALQIHMRSMAGPAATIPNILPELQEEIREAAISAGAKLR